jgi:hypothetical protein
MRCSRFCPPVDLGRSAFSGFRFPPEIIVLAVRWYLRYGLSYRDLEELMAERGVEVDHVTLFRWVRRFTPLLVEEARPCRHAASGRWFVDETYVKLSGIWRCVYRAADDQDQVIDVYVSARRDIAAATTNSVSERTSIYASGLRPTNSPRQSDRTERHRRGSRRLIDQCNSAAARARIKRRAPTRPGPQHSPRPA